jgi:hypothetical protein
LAMTDPRCMEVIVEPKQVCHDRAKGFDGDKPRLALASPRRCNAAAKTVAIWLAKNCIRSDTPAGPVARKRFAPVLE